MFVPFCNIISRYTSKNLLNQTQHGVCVSAIFVSSIRFLSGFAKKKLFTALYTENQARECHEEFYIINADNSLPGDGDVIALSFVGNGTPTPASGDGALFTPTGIEAGTRGDLLVRKDNAI